MSGWRNIKVDGRTFRFRFGHGNVVIRDAANKATVVDYATITGRSWSIIERGQHKKTSDGMVKPGHVRGWIRKRLLGKEPPSAVDATRPVVDGIGVFNRRTYKPCRYCGHDFARSSGCLCGGTWMTHCPSCGCPVAEPDNGEAWSAPIDLSGLGSAGRTLVLGEGRVDPELGPDRLTVQRLEGAAIGTYTIHHATGPVALEPGQSASFIAVPSHVPVASRVLERLFGMEVGTLGGRVDPKPGPAVFVPEESIR